jgi:hypothetical protein
MNLYIHKHCLQVPKPTVILPQSETVQAMHLWTQNAKTAQIRRSEMNGFMLIWALPKPHANTNCVLDNAFCGYAIFQIATSLRLQRERCSITGNSEMVMLHQEERRNGNGIPMANLIRKTEYY